MAVKTKTIKEKRKECRKKGLVYDTTTKRCRQPKKRGRSKKSALKKQTAKKAVPKAVPKQKKIVSKKTALSSGEADEYIALLTYTMEDLEDVQRSIQYMQKHKTVVSADEKRKFLVKLNLIQADADDIKSIVNFELLI